MRRYKVAYEEKIKIVTSYLSGEVGYEDSVKAANNSEKSFREWVLRYKTGGAATLLPCEKNTAYSPELKLQAVRAYLSGEESMEGICQRFQISGITTLSRWIKVYNAHGDFNSVKQSGGGSYMKQGRETRLDERIQIVRDCIASGKNYGEMAQKYQVSYQQVRNWTLRFEELGEAGLEDRRGRRKKDQTPRTELELAQIEIEQLKHKLYLAEMERDLLKKLEEIERRDVSQE